MLEVLQDEERWLVVDPEDPPGALTVFEGEGAQDRATAYAEWVTAVLEGETPLLTWPERQAADASLRLFIEATIHRAIIGFDTAMYNAQHYQALAQEQADRVFGLERQLKALERAQGLPPTTTKRPPKKHQPSLLDVNTR